MPIIIETISGTSGPSQTDRIEGIDLKVWLNLLGIKKYILELVWFSFGLLHTINIYLRSNFWLVGEKLLAFNAHQLNFPYQIWYWIWSNWQIEWAPFYFFRNDFVFYYTLYDWVNNTFTNLYTKKVLWNSHFDKTK